MKSILLVLSLFFAVTTTFGQTYYVAVIKGKVYYDNKLLKKRDKIKLKGNLRFSSVNDYLKVSGPGGLFTISPNEADKVGRNEFLVAVKKELFPTIRARSTVAHSISSPDSLRFFGFEWVCRTYFEETAFPIRSDLLAEGETMGFIHETDQGLFFREADLKDNALIIKARNFKLAKKGDPQPAIKQTAIVVIKDQETWQKILDTTTSMEALRPQLDEYMEYPNTIQEVLSIEVDSDGNTREVPPLKPIPKAALILDFLGPSRFISRRAFLKDIRFHVKHTGASSVSAFLDDFEFEDYIYDTYGDVYQLYSVLAEETKLDSDF